MEFLKSIIDIIASWFKKSTIKLEQEVASEDAKVSAAVNKIQAASNATSIQHIQHIQEDLHTLHEKHKQEQQDAKTNPTDNPFGDSW